MKKLFLPIWLLSLLFSGCSNQTKSGGLYKNTLSYNSYAEMIKSWEYQNKYEYKDIPVTFDIEKSYKDLGHFKYFITGWDVTSRYRSVIEKQNQHILVKRSMSVLIGSGILLYFSTSNQLFEKSNLSWILVKANINNEWVEVGEFPEYEPIWYYPQFDDSFKIGYIYCLTNDSRE